MLYKILNIGLSLLLLVSCSSASNYVSYKEGSLKDILDWTTNEIINQSNDLKSLIVPEKLIVLDPGHQAHGDSSLEAIGPGSSTQKAKVTVGTHGLWSGLNEYELTLDVALKLKDELMGRGYEVIMTREENDVNLSNSQRAAIANENKADAFIRLHANGADNSSLNGAMTICQTKDNPYNKEYYESSYKLSYMVLESYVESTGIKKEDIWQTDTMSGINWCQVPVTILEMGYMTNKSDDLNMADAAFQKKMVDGIANGIDAFFS